jgi:hypothetical protein
MKRLHLITLLAIAVPFLASAPVAAAATTPFGERARGQAGAAWLAVATNPLPAVSTIRSRSAKLAGKSRSVARADQ